MSDLPKAVFLSYAREDAEPARHIAEALRAFGVEVWFDQNELHGGDAWDAKIKKQIRDCALFVPLVSRRTEERSEGYFRREWKLAVDRTHDMAGGKAFLVPVVIDDTPEADAAVPEEFMRYQWTRLAHAEPTPEFVMQVKRLLDTPKKAIVEAGRPAAALEPARRRRGERGEVHPPAAVPEATRGVASPKKRWPSLPGWAIGALAAVIIGVVAAPFLSRKPAPAPAPLPDAATALSEKSIAVLAFANLSDDKGNEYFSDGISEELLNVLAKVPGLKVSARTSAFYFKGKDTPIPEIAKQLGVAYVVEGSVRKSGDRVRITAQLIKAADGFHVWSDTFTRDLKDIFAVQDEIAGLIAQNLQLTLGGAGPPKAAVNPEAYRLVLEGRYFLAQRGEENFDRAQQAFATAVEIAPGLAVAYSGLAEVAALRGRYRLLEGAGRTNEFTEEVLANARRALELDPALPDPYAVMAIVLTDNQRLDEAEAEVQRAYAANPNYAAAYQEHSHILAARGRLDLAMQQLQQAGALDPLSFIGLYIRGAHLAYAGRHGEALALFDRAAAIRGELFLPIEGDRAHTLLELGRTAEAMPVARTILQHPDLLQAGWWAAGDALHALRQGGAEAEAARLGEALLRIIPEGSYQRGYVLCALGRFDEGLPGLENSPTLVRTRLYYVTMLDPVRDTPGFGRLLEKFDGVAEHKVARATLARMRREQEARK